MKGLAVTLLVASFWWWRSDPDVEKGNAKAQAGKYDEALADFDRAEQSLDDEEQKKIVSFDRGVALSGAGRHEDARKAFAHAAQAEDPVVRSRAAYNEGNAALALKDKPGAIDAYVRSLRADPDFAPAKRNLEYLLTMEDPPSDGGEGGDGGGGGDGGNGDGGGGGGDGGSDGGSDGGGGGGGGDGGPPDGGRSDGGQQQPPPKQQEQPQQVSEQDAMKILDAMRDAEKHRPLGRIMLKDNQPPRSNKEW